MVPSLYQADFFGSRVYYNLAREDACEIVVWRVLGQGGGKLTPLRAPKTRLDCEKTRRLCGRFAERRVETGCGM